MRPPPFLYPSELNDTSLMHSTDLCLGDMGSGCIKSNKATYTLDINDFVYRYMPMFQKRNIAFLRNIEERFLAIIWIAFINSLNLSFESTIEKFSDRFEFLGIF